MRTKLSRLAHLAKDWVKGGVSHHFIEPLLAGIDMRLAEMAGAIADLSSSQRIHAEKVEQLRLELSPTRQIVLKTEDSVRLLFTKVTRARQYMSALQLTAEGATADLNALKLERDKLVARADGIFQSHHEMAVRIAALELGAKQRSDQTLEILDKMESRFEQQKKEFGLDR